MGSPRAAAKEEACEHLFPDRFLGRSRIGAGLVLRRRVEGEGEEWTSS